MWNLKTPDSQTQKVAHLFRLVKKVVNFRDRLYMRRLYFNKTECVQISRHQIPKCQMVSIFRTTALGTLGENVFVYSDWKFYTTHQQNGNVSAFLEASLSCIIYTLE